MWPVVSLMPKFHFSLWQNPSRTFVVWASVTLRKPLLPHLEPIIWFSCCDFKKVIQFHFFPLKTFTSLKYISVHGLRWTENSNFFHKSLTNGNWAQRCRSNCGHLRCSGAGNELQRTSGTPSDSATTETREDHPTRPGLTTVNGTPLPCTCVWRRSGFCIGLLCWTNTSDSPFKTDFMFHSLILLLPRQGKTPNKGTVAIVWVPHKGAAVGRQRLPSYH